MRKILLIEDDEADQFLCAFMFQKIMPNVELVKAYDGQEALEILDQQSSMPDLILLDINMPRMNGHEFLKHYVNKYDENQVKDVVVLTSSDQPHDKEKMSAYACVKDYLLKPVSVEALERIAALRR